MKKMTSALAVLFIAASTLTSAAAAKPALKEVVEIQERLITIGMAYELQDKCDTLSARIIRGTAALLGVERRARELGYSKAEIDAYQRDKVEKERLIVIARARLAELGVDPAEPVSYCTVGRNEIEAGSAIGRLIW